MIQFIGKVFLFLILFQGLYAQISYPDRIYADLEHYPFTLGVASADPLPTEVLLWTAVQSEFSLDFLLLWEIALDDSFNEIVNAGFVTATPDTDHTVTINATGLEADTYYYYRFITEEGASSFIGRTKTAQVGDNEEVKFGVASCSSIYSGYFNAYRKMAERNDLDAVVHLGDYIYDFVDTDEEVRVPDPYPSEPANLEEWRDRHEYYLLDPDLRLLRASHPIIVMWDNHDTNRSNEVERMESVQAFREYVPVRTAEDQDADKIYRSFKFGDLVDLTMMDITMFRDQDPIGPTEVSVLGLEQQGWLFDRMEASTGRWKVYGQQKMFGGWGIDGIPFELPIPTDDPVIDSTSWDGYDGERDLILEFWRDNEMDNNIVLSGDAHISMSMDLAIDPYTEEGYNTVTKEGSLGVEFLPASITRGNLDESGVPPEGGVALENLDRVYNPHHHYMEFFQHGYGILHFNRDSCLAEYWYCPILEYSEENILGKQLVLRDGENHWAFLTDVVDGQQEVIDNEISIRRIEQSLFKLTYQQLAENDITWNLFNINGEKFNWPSIFDFNSHVLNLNSLGKGIYILEGRTKGSNLVFKKKLVN